MKQVHISDEQKKRAEDFHSLHHLTTPLILPNAWDAVSTKVFELEGFKAIGTTSAGIASALGYRDGERMSWSENLCSVRRIIKNTKLPVSVDIETGYSQTIEGLVKNVEEVLEAGAVGINLEDGSCGEKKPLTEMTEQVEKIIAIRELADSKNIKLFINARTDVFLNSDETKIMKLYHAVRRGNAYTEAGADGIFIPDTGDLNSSSIKTLAVEINAPLNIIAGSNTPPIGELAKLGIARVSLGPRPMRAALQLIKNISRELLDEGTYVKMSDSSITYTEVNSWFE